jgi:hypothetical protein
MCINLFHRVLEVSIHSEVQSWKEYYRLGNMDEVSRLILAQGML